MSSAARVLKISVVVFKVLAWVALALQVVAGLILLIFGGEPVAIGGIGGFELPARVVGVLNFVAAAVYFCSFWFLSAVVQVLLEVRAHAAGGSGS
jgi:hypothetical protein